MLQIISQLLNFSEVSIKLNFKRLEIDQNFLFKLLHSNCVFILISSYFSESHWDPKMSSVEKLVESSSRLSSRVGT